MVDRPAGGIAKFGDAGQLPASSLMTMLQDDRQALGGPPSPEVAMLEKKARQPPGFVFMRA